MEVNLPFLLCVALYLRAIFQGQAAEGLYLEGRFNGVFLRYRFGGLIHGGAYFRNFTVSIVRVSRGREPIDSCIDNIKRNTTLNSISEVRSAMLDRNVWKDFVIRLDPEVGLSK